MNVIVILIRTMTTLVTFGTLLALNILSIEAGINASVINSIVSYACLLTALAFYFVYKEKLVI